MILGKSIARDLSKVSSILTRLLRFGERNLVQFQMIEGCMSSLSVVARA